MNKKIILTVMFITAVYTVNINAAPGLIGSGFSYQGELIEGGSPANGSYDVMIDAYNYDDVGSVLASQTFLAVSVTSGLFNIPVVDLGDALYKGDEVWLEISVREAGVGSYVALSPRQRVSAAPYAVQAEFLAANGASGGDLLVFSGVDWIPQASSNISPWTINGSVIYTNQYIGVGLQNPSSVFHINTAGGENPLRIQVGGNTKLKVEANGSTTIGTNYNATPDNGLYVHGDVKQLSTANGMMKYMFRANCEASPTIMREYNGTHINGTAGIAFNSTGNCTITLPFNISTNYISVSPIHAISGNNRIATCSNILSGMVCQVSIGLTGAPVNGLFDVLVY